MTMMFAVPVACLKYHSLNGIWGNNPILRCIWTYEVQLCIHILTSTQCKWTAIYIRTWMSINITLFYMDVIIDPCVSSGGDLATLY